MTLKDNCDKTERSSSNQVTDGVTDAIKIGTCVAAVANTAGEEIMKTGVRREVTKEVVSRAISKTGQQIVSSGVRTVTKEVLAQTTQKTGEAIVKTGIGAVTKKVVAQTTVKTGQQVVKTGIKTVTNQVVAQTTFSNSLIIH